MANLANEGDKRYLMVTIVVNLHEEPPKKALEERFPITRDSLKRSRFSSSWRASWPCATGYAAWWPTPSVLLSVSLWSTSSTFLSDE
jgi:hypothetical protein